MERICAEKHKNLDERIAVLQDIVGDYGIRLSKTERAYAEQRVLIEQLCKQIENLTGAIKWIGGPLLAGIAGFFFYAIQQVAI